MSGILGFHLFDVFYSKNIVHELRLIFPNIKLAMTPNDLPRPNLDGTSLISIVYPRSIGHFQCRISLFQFSWHMNMRKHNIHESDSCVTSRNFNIKKGRTHSGEEFKRSRTTHRWTCGIPCERQEQSTRCHFVVRLLGTGQKYLLPHRIFRLLKPRLIVLATSSTVISAYAPSCIIEITYKLRIIQDGQKHLMPFRLMYKSTDISLRKPIRGKHASYGSRQSAQKKLAEEDQNIYRGNYGGGCASICHNMVVPWLHQNFMERGEEVTD